MNIEGKQKITSKWFKNLRNKICAEFIQIEKEYAEVKEIQAGKFKRKKWNRDGGGGGEMSIMKGNVFEKVGVNISTVFGQFSDKFKDRIPGASEDPNFWASGISLVAHMSSPLIPAIHINTRFICTTKNWFGGGIDLTPAITNESETNRFHQILKDTCDKHNNEYYPKFKKNCQEYFFIKHRNEERGVGGIFYDYLNSDNFNNDFNFTKDVGMSLLQIFPEIVRSKMFKKYTKKDKDKQLIKRGRYAEFNLLYDRGTKFGLMTDGNPEAILMSLPPLAKWE
ncbi:oxygen-dependent coproporphyrinogen oxidase [Rickettsiales bacterium]|nr:oxygen-dependent coproporphyrinogen oxidase [Rickettsiales bacterium]